MANAIIDTLKAKNASGEEVIVYPRTSFDAVKNDDGKTLTETLNENANDITELQTQSTDIETRLAALETSATSLSSILTTETF